MSAECRECGQKYFYSSDVTKYFDRYGTHICTIHDEIEYLHINCSKCNIFCFLNLVKPYSKENIINLYDKCENEEKSEGEGAVGGWNESKRPQETDE